VRSDRKHEDVERPGPSRRHLVRLFLRSRADPEAFARALASRTVASFPFPVSGTRVLDLGCGTGWFAAMLAEAGSEVVAGDVDITGVAAAATRAPRVLVADAARAPFPDATFDGVFCSNVVEHTPDPRAVLTEIERVLRPGGWAYVSWTNWLSPWGGHAIAPLHYLGPERGLRVYRRLFGEPTGRNLPYAGVWPTSIRSVLSLVRARPGLLVERATPRYYPSQSWILRVPGLREVATWNCLLLLRRVGSHQEPPRSRLVTPTRPGAAEQCRGGGDDGRHGVPDHPPPRGAERSVLTGEQ
jgi:SAM-dependent methyltransferase